tara:strand:+ start:112 stop:372 length:261 start_codon:yes stop_codon:yes gene_type:complete
MADIIKSAPTEFRKTCNAVFSAIRKVAMPVVIGGLVAAAMMTDEQESDVDDNIKAKAYLQNIKGCDAQAFERTGDPCNMTQIPTAE